MGFPKAQWLTSSSLPAFHSAGHVTPQIFMLSRGRTTLLRWLHLVQIARTLLVLLTARAEPHALIRLGGWRPAATLTLVKDALAARFRNFEAFRLLPEPCRKSGPARHTGPPAIAAAA